LRALGKPIHVLVCAASAWKKIQEKSSQKDNEFSVITFSQHPKTVPSGEFLWEKGSII